MACHVDPPHPRKHYHQPILVNIIIIITSSPAGFGAFADVYEHSPMDVVKHWKSFLHGVLPMISTSLRPRGDMGYKGVGVLFDILPSSLPRNSVTTHLIGSRKDIEFVNPFCEHQKDAAEIGLDGTPPQESSGLWIQTAARRPDIEKHPIHDCPVDPPQDLFSSGLGFWKITSLNPSWQLLAPGNACSEKARVTAQLNKDDWQVASVDSKEQKCPTWVNVGYKDKLFANPANYLFDTADAQITSCSL